MQLVYSLLDRIGLYLRFGTEPIVSFFPQTWGGVYHSATSVSEVDHITHGGVPVAFDIKPGQPIPYGALASFLRAELEDVRAQVEPEAVRLGWVW